MWMSMFLSLALNGGAHVPVIQLKNKTLNAIDVAVMLGESPYDQTRVAALSSTIIKVPGIPGTFTVQYSRGDLMANNVIEVPVVEGTGLIFYDTSYEIVKPK